LLYLALNNPSTIFISSVEHSPNYCDVDPKSCNVNTGLYKNILVTDFEDFKIRKRLDEDLKGMRNPSESAKLAIKRTLEENPKSVRAKLNSIIIMDSFEDKLDMMETLVSGGSSTIKPAVLDLVYIILNSLDGQKLFEHRERIFILAQVFVDFTEDNSDFRMFFAKYGYLTENYRQSHRCLNEPLMPHTIKKYNGLLLLDTGVPPLYQLLSAALRLILNEDENWSEITRRRKKSQKLYFKGCGGRQDN